jgi:hypothetical protein
MPRNKSNKQNNLNYQSLYLLVSFLWNVITLQLSKNSVANLLSLSSGPLLFVPSVSAQSLSIQTIVPEFQVNNATTGNQYAPAFASFSSGEWVIVWLSGSTNSIINAQRFTEDGQRLEAEFRINNNYAAGSLPRVMSFVNDDWIVVWISGNNIYAQQFTKNATAIGVEFQVNSAMAMPNSASSFFIGSLTADEWAVVWGNKISNDFDIYAQRLSINGSAIGSQFRVNTNTTSNQYNPTFTSLNTGDWIVAWQGFQTGDSDIYAQRLAADGATLGEEFRVNTNITDQQQTAKLISLDSNEWVVIWESGNGGGDIYARRFANNGTALNQEFRVNSDGIPRQRNNPICSAFANDYWIVIWQQTSKNSFQSSPLNGRLFGNNGSPLGSEFPFNISSFVSNFAIINLADKGKWVAAWTAMPQVSNSDVYAAIFSLNLSSLTTTSFLSSTTVNVQTTNQIFSNNNSMMTQSMTSPLNSLTTTSSMTMLTTLINQSRSSAPQAITMTNNSSGISGGVIGAIAGVAGVSLAACFAGMGFYACRKKSREKQANNSVAQKELENSLQNTSQVTSASANYSRLDEIKKSEKQYDEPMKLEI